MLKHIVIVGAGNVAHHFAKALDQSGFKIVQVYSRTLSSAQKLALHLNCPPTTDINNIYSNADLYLFMLSDTGIKEVASKFPYKNKLMLHTSGSIPMQVFKNKTDRYGVIYPFQTFRREINIDFEKVPICIEACNDMVKQMLTDLSERLKCKSFYLNSEQRRTLHLSAVFSCNFMNHMINIGEKILDEKNIDREILKPLLEQSFSNIINHSAGNSQTGPAIRNDKEVMEKHLEILSDNESLKNIYLAISKNIQTFKKQL